MIFKKKILKKQKKKNFDLEQKTKKKKKKKKFSSDFYVQQGKYFHHLSCILSAAKELAILYTQDEGYSILVIVPMDGIEQSNYGFNTNFYRSIL